MRSSASRFMFVLLSLHFVVTTAIAVEPAQLKVMTYNIRYASPSGENSWPSRRPMMKKLIERNDPDLIGTQEGLYGQLKDLESDLPKYRWIGLGREGGSRGEFMAIYYRHERFEPLEYDHYWLSDTPSVIGSSTWGNSVRRMVTWIKFHDRAGKRDLYFINTHFDHMVENARQRSAKLVAERTGALDAAIPTILTGDFNTPAESSASYKTLTADGLFADAWLQAKKTTDRTATFNGFRYPAPSKGARIDWILLRGPIQPVGIGVDDAAENEQYPSDHFPVIATLQYAP